MRGAFLHKLRQIPVRQRIYVDETGVTTSMTRLSQPALLLMRLMFGLIGLTFVLLLLASVAYVLWYVLAGQWRWDWWLILALLFIGKIFPWPRKPRPTIWDLL